MGSGCSQNPKVEDSNEYKQNKHKQPMKGGNSVTSTKRNFLN